MSFARVGDQIVFLDDTRFSDLRGEAFDMDFDRGGMSDVQYRIRALRDPDLHEATLKRMHELLVRKFRADPASFVLNWVRFDLREKDAQRNVERVVGDHFVMHGIVRDTGHLFHGFSSDPLMSDRTQGDESIARAFSIAGRLDTSWFGKRRPLTLDLNTDEVERVVGDLRDFAIEMKCGALLFNAFGVRMRVGRAGAAGPTSSA